jgi:hypothetical protein
MNHFRIILAAGAGVAALAIGVPIAAHPEHATTENVREINTVTKDGDKTIEIHQMVKGDKAERTEIDETTMVANCGGGRKFESVAQSGEGDRKNVNKIVLCADKDETQAQWDKTLRDALARIESDKNLPSEGKAKIMADLRNEIAKNGK